MGKSIFSIKNLEAYLNSAALGFILIFLDIHTTQKVHSPRMTFAEIVGLVPSSSFARIHQSYIVNIALMDKIENNHVHINAHKIPISQPNRESFFKRIDLV